MDELDNLWEQMCAWGLNIKSPISIQLDNRIHRVPTVNSGRETPGWYAGGSSGDKMWCTYSSWDAGESKPQLFTTESCVYDSRFRDEAAIERFVKSQAEIERKLTNDNAAITATQYIAECTPAPADHPYLIKKNVLPHEALIDRRGHLIISVCTKDGVIRSYQSIAPDGSKKLMAGGQKQGCCHAFMSKGKSSKVYLCEGWATAATVFEATGRTTVCCFDATNLKNVAALANPKQLIVCADNDHRKEKNVGLDAARNLLELGLVSDIVAPKCSGTDFNDMAMEFGLEAVKELLSRESDAPIRMTHDEIVLEKDKSTLVLDASITDPGGLISLGMEACAAGNIADIPEYNLPIIYATIARAISGVIRMESVWPVLYAIKVGGTSTGKTNSDIFLSSAIKRSITGFYGPTSFASGAGLLRGLVDSPKCLVNLDEITYLLQRSDKVDPLTKDKIGVLLELYTNCGREINKTYGDGKKSIFINYPCVNIVGNATPLIFDAIRPEDVLSGLLQRFTFWYYRGKMPRRVVSFSDQEQTNNPALTKFITGIANLLNPVKTGLPPVLSTVGCAMQTIVSPEAQDFLQVLSDELTSDETNGLTEEGTKGVMFRQFEEVQKYAMIHMASRCSDGGLCQTPVALQDVEYGYKIVSELSRWKIDNILDGRVSQNEFDADCMEMIEATKIALVSSKMPTFTELSIIRPKLKAWRPRYLQDVIASCSGRGLIVEDKTTRLPRYYPTKQAGT